jgi:hypothetical protein
MLLFSPESVVVVVYNNKGFVGPSSSSSSFFAFANSKGERGEIGFRYNLVNTPCKEQMGQVVRLLVSLFVC